MKYFNIRRRSGGSARRPRWENLNYIILKNLKHLIPFRSLHPCIPHPFRPFPNRNRDQRWRRYTLGLHIWRSRN